MGTLTLSVDTTSRRGGVCLLADARVLCELNIDAGLTFSEKLLEMIDFLFRVSGVTLDEVDLLAVSTGPGSFTGLRVGIATMKALALRLERPLIGVTTLEALVAGVSDTGVVAAFMDARRNQVFAALFEKSSADALPVVIREGEASAPFEWIASLTHRAVRFVGDGTLPYRSLIEAAGHSVARSDFFVAREVAAIARHRLVQGAVPPLHLLDAYYIRPADAEMSAVGRAARRRAG